MQVFSGLLGLGMRFQFMGWDSPLQKKMASHSSILAWRIPWTEEAGGLQSMGLQRVRPNLVTKNSNKKWSPLKQEVLCIQETLKPLNINIS